MSINTLLTAKDVAQALKISKPLVYRMIDEGQLPAVRFRRTVRVRQEDLDAFVASNLSHEKNNMINGLSRIS
jgi:excisionase family DNA binding protein